MAPRGPFRCCICLGSFPSLGLQPTRDLRLSFAWLSIAFDSHVSANLGGLSVRLTGTIPLFFRKLSIAMFVKMGSIRMTFLTETCLLAASVFSAFLGVRLAVASISAGLRLVGADLRPGLRGTSAGHATSPHHRRSPNAAADPAAALRWVPAFFVFIF